MVIDNSRAVLMLDQQRVIKMNFDFDICLIELSTALRELKYLSKISRGVFLPENITAHYINYENEKIYTLNDLTAYLNGLEDIEKVWNPYLRHKVILEFELNNVKCSLVGNIDLSIVAGQINHLLKDNSYEFVLYDICPDGLLMFLNQEEKQKIQSERGLELYNIEHRVLATTFTPNKHELSRENSSPTITSSIQMGDSFGRY